MNVARMAEIACGCCMEHFGILHGITKENCGHLRMVVPL